MDTNDKNQAISEPIETAEDAALETEALSELKEGEVRAKVAAEYGLDPENPDHVPFLDKVTSERVANSKKLSTAIRQKRAWREKANKPPEKPAEEHPEAKKPPQPPVEDVSKLVDTRFDERLDDEKLAEIELSDEDKAELKAYAKSKGITARQALKSDYFTYLKGREDTKKREEEASLGRTELPNSAKKTFDPNKPPQVDMATEEGRKKWDEWLDGVQKQTRSS